MEFHDNNFFILILQYYFQSQINDKIAKLHLMKKETKNITSKTNILQNTENYSHNHKNITNQQYQFNSPNKENHFSIANHQLQMQSPPQHIQMHSPPQHLQMNSPVQQQQLHSPLQQHLTNLYSPPKTTSYQTLEGFRSNKSKQSGIECSKQSEEILFSGLSKDGRYKVRSRALHGAQLVKAVQFQRKMALSCMLSSQKQKQKNNQKVGSFESAKKSTKAAGMVKGYAVNTHNGISRSYNEDRVSITLNIKKNGLKSQFFAVYDGHGGSKCCDYLKDNLHQLIINHKYFPEDPRKAIHESILKCENEFTQEARKNKSQKNGLQRSGSCALVALVVEEYVYIANVGDSRAILSSQHGKYAFNLTRDHRPVDEKEQERILSKGGKIYRTQMEPLTKGTKNDMIIGPLRIYPGKLSVSRTLGDIEAKHKEFGGITGVISAEADIRKFKISQKEDFILLCCDGILQRMESTQIVELSWKIMGGGDVHEAGGKVVDGILRECMSRGSSDNLTVIMIWLNDKRVDAYRSV